MRRKKEEEKTELALLLGPVAPHPAPAQADHQDQKVSANDQKMQLQKVGEHFKIWNNLQKNIYSTGITRNVIICPNAISRQLWRHP